MTQQIYVRADEYYRDIDILKNMIEDAINEYVAYSEIRLELLESAFSGVELSASPSKRAPQVLRLDDSDVVSPEDVVVGIDTCWVKIEDYAEDMWAVYTNAYTEIVTSNLISDRIKHDVSMELDDVAHYQEFVDNMSLLDIRRYTKD